MASTPHVLRWGWFSIELANLLVILSMVVLFVLALVVPFGRASRVRDDGRDRP